ncbi:MAG: hypothetical protein ACI9OJ_004880, partial [Myxococcota bacterium]
MAAPAIRDRVRGAFLRLAREHASTGRLSIAIAVGVIIGVSPYYGLHIWMGLLIGRIFKLNQVAVFLGEQIGLPFIAPFWAFASIQIGHRLRHGTPPDLPDEASLTAARALMVDWIIGSLIVGVVLAIALGAVAYVVLSRVRAREQPVAWTGKSRGTAKGYAFVYTIVRVLGRRGGYLLLWVALPYYFLFARTARRTSRRYLELRFGPRPWWVRKRDEWRHLHTFAK